MEIPKDSFNCDTLGMEQCKVLGFDGFLCNLNSLVDHS